MPFAVYLRTSQDLQRAILEVATISNYQAIVSANRSLLPSLPKRLSCISLLSSQSMDVILEQSTIIPS